MNAVKKLIAQVQYKKCNKTNLDFVEIALFMNGGIEFVVSATSFKEAVKRMNAAAKRFSIANISTVEFI